MVDKTQFRKALLLLVKDVISMGLLFLIPLMIALGVSYLFKNSTDELAELTVLLTIACLIVSVILTPWQLKILILILVIFKA
ncbi:MULTISPECIES: hypothetical protein [Nostocaceae]|nr:MULTISPECIES: hypothetical protein [Nostocaceae]